jgi:hypothetical protein
MKHLPISLQLMDPNCKPIHARAYTVPRSVEQQLQQNKEIVRLVDIGVLEEVYSSEWDSVFPSFAISKKNGTIIVVTDLGRTEFNLMMKHQPFPIPKIGEMISSMERSLISGYSTYSSNFLCHPFQRLGA